MSERPKRQKERERETKESQRDQRNRKNVSEKTNEIRQPQRDRIESQILADDITKVQARPKGSRVIARMRVRDPRTSEEILTRA